MLPESLLHLSFRTAYPHLNKILDKNDILPSSLKTLAHCRLDKSIVLPSSITTLDIVNYHLSELTSHCLPPSLEYLSIRYSNISQLSAFPATLKTLKLSSLVDQRFQTHPGILPASLTYFKIGVDQPVEELLLPQSLLILKFGSDFNQRLVPYCLPPSITCLSLGPFFASPIQLNVLPASLRRLKFGDRFNKPIEAGVLPQSLTSLSFGTKFNRDVNKDGCLPQSLIKLKFGSKFDKPFVTVPRDLRRLTIPWRQLDSISGQQQHHSIQYINVFDVVGDDIRNNNKTYSTLKLDALKLRFISLDSNSMLSCKQVAKSFPNIHTYTMIVAKEFTLHFRVLDLNTMEALVTHVTYKHRHIIRYVTLR
ncbi:hypothetical protein SAMD00019534_090910 [Acytostelium subglobosum LB1]|uniref:hypothetical protein n=1 Tax=Acytostelium subglobosum LB1 TaxID=1410327 RepID=UPI000644FA4A|nr:hypothetical protein SAMD00019534_090910 [Acytostelium subglobosum LB1]GAM25916.1 hypothetical protein SAMD00019534_090910 [Acytostelium subglobosum LB1]|eukprot:XP_012750959.1 hypothetical protein SAMD00019534_090910 [Acytostelium subglobosum LB1]